MYKKILVGLVIAVFVITNQVFAQSMSQMDSALEQSAGSYPVMDMGYISSLGMQQKAWNNPLRHLGEGQSKPGYSRYLWKPDIVLPIRVREGMMTLINFPSWELIENVWIGAKEAFSGEIPAPNALLLYPTPGMAGVDTNLVVFGRSGNRYAFYVRSETYNTERITHSIVDVIVMETPSGASVSGVKSGAPLWAASSGGSGFIQPGKGLNPTLGLNTAGNAPIDWLDNIPVNPDQFRFDIDIFIPNPEDVEIAPEHVWRDEVFTYIDLGKKALSMNERPIVNLLVQNSETPVGFRTKGPHGRLIVVEAVGDLVLRNGKRIICLKLRRDPEFGLDKTDYANTKEWFYQTSTRSANNAGVGGAEGIQQGSGMNQGGLKEDNFSGTSQPGGFGQANLPPNGIVGYGTGSDNVGNANASVSRYGYGQGGQPMGMASGQGRMGSGSGPFGSEFDYHNAVNNAGVSASMMGGNANGPAPSPMFQGYDFGIGSNGQGGGSNYHQLQSLPRNAYDNGGAYGILDTYNQLSSSQGGYSNPYGVSGISNAGTIAVELGTNVEISRLERLWDSVYDRNNDILRGYEPYFSVDSKSNATGREVFHLRIGPIEDVYAGDGLCKKLGRRGVKCSVVRIQ